MAMPQRDFEAIAEAVAYAKRQVERFENDSKRRESALYALTLVARELATASARQYRGGYGFKRDKFMAAAGFPDA